MQWKIDYTETAIKSLFSLDRQAVKRIRKYIEEKVALAENPRVFGKSLSGNLAGIWRYRVGDYRILCEIQDKEITILVVNVGHRKNIYN